MTMRYFQNNGKTYGYDTGVSTDETLIADAIAANWTEVTGSWPPAPTAIQTAAIAATSALASGMILTCTSNGDLNATYATSMNTKVDVLGILGYIGLKGSFIGGATSMNWYDISGIPHSFTVSQFTEFAEALGVFIQAVEDYAITGSGSIPSNAVTIA